MSDPAERFMTHPAVALFGELLDGVQEADPDKLWLVAEFLDREVCEPGVVAEETGVDPAAGGFSSALCAIAEDSAFYGDTPSENLRAWRDGQVLRAAGVDVAPYEERVQALRDLDLNGPAGTRGGQHPGGGE